MVNKQFKRFHANDVKFIVCKILRVPTVFGKHTINDDYVQGVAEVMPA